jgi:tetratricopeptide (TPR) repeat protein
LRRAVLGQVASIEGDYTVARVLFQASLAIVRELWDKRGIADALNNLGFVAERQGHYARAHSLLEESLAISRELADKLGTAHDLEGLARLASAEEQPDRAARLFGAAEALRNAIGAALPPAARAEHERHAAAIRSRLGEESFTIAWAEGRAMTLDQLVTYASQMVVQA